MSNLGYPIDIRKLSFTMPGCSERLPFMHLKQARARGQLAEFIRERKKTHPHTRKHRFRTVVKLMALNQRRAKRGEARAIRG